MSQEALTCLENVIVIGWSFEHNLVKPVGSPDKVSAPRPEAVSRRGAHSDTGVSGAELSQDGKQIIG